MQTHAQAVVIGGGIIGCSVAYHLANQGVTEVLLVEKSELTAGSTWHAAGQIAFYADSVLNSRLQKESFEFYTELERAGQPVGQHVCGSLRLALHPEQLREFQSFSARARYLDIDHEIVGAAEARALFPLLYTNEVVGALHIPGDGYVDPNMTTQGIAAQARTHGAVIERFTEVTGLEQLASGEWKVETDRGDIRCETVVNCAGFWAPQLSALLGFELPIVAVEDEYLVTEAIPEVESLDTELPILRDMSTPFYLRQERNGLMVSCYEDEPKFWSLDGIPANFGRELLPVDLERAEDKLQRTMQFVPALQTAGIKTVVNGPLGRTPDVVGLLGPAHGLRGYWVFCGEMAGFFRSSAARYLAEWIISGEPGIDLSALDVRRFDPNMSKQHAVDRLMSGHIYSLPVYYPHTEPGGGRNFKRTALHLRLGQRGAVFGEQNGWEVPNWFCGEKPDAADEPSLNHANWFGAVAAECRAARDHVALIDLGSLAKFKIEGPGAAAWLDWLLTSRLPDVGHSKNAHCLTSGGRLAASFLVSRLSEQSFYLTDFAVNEQRDEDWLVKTAPSRGVSIANVTVTTAAIGIFGPKSRLLLQSLTEQSLSNDNFHRLALHEIHIGGIGVTAIRHSLTGELGFELHVDADAQATLYEKLVEAGQAHSVVDAGWRALDSLRLEKGWRRSGTDYALAAEPSSAGVTLDIAPGKGEFLGRSALEDCRERSRVPVTLLIDTGAAPVAPWGEETVLVDGVHTAFTSSGGYGHRVESAIALASIPGNLVSAQTVEVEILGKRYAARIETRAAYDPGGLRMRS